MKQQDKQRGKKSGEAKKRKEDDAISDEQEFENDLARSATPLRNLDHTRSFDLTTSLLEPPLEEERESQIQKLLEQMDLKIEDFTDCSLSEADLERLLYPSRTGIVVRWLTFEKTLLKTFLYPIIRKRYLNYPLYGSSHELSLQRSDTVINHYGPIYCEKRVWPQYRAIPIQTQSVLKKIAGVEGFLRGTGFWTGQIWSLLLVSFLSNDLYLYYRYPERRYGDTLLDVFTLQSSHQGALAAALTSPLVWPELLLVPLAFGLLQGLYESYDTKVLDRAEKEKLLQKLSQYKPSFYQDILRWLLPMHPLEETLERIEQTLLWDGTVSVADREELLQGVMDFNRKAKKFSQWKSLSTLANIADSLGPKDAISLHEAHIPKDVFQSLLVHKSKTLQELRTLASHYQMDKRGSSYSLLPLFRFLKAHYLLWSLGRGMSYFLALPFWLLKASRVYSKGVLLQTILLGITTIIIQYLKEQACKAEGKHWGYIPAIQTYNCTVCGDFPVFYRNSFTSQDCLWDFLNKTRNATDIIRLFERVDWTEIPSLDLSHQITPQGNRTLWGRDLETALQPVKKQDALVEFIYKGSSDDPLEITSCQAIARFINGTQIKSLILQFQKITNKGIEALLPGLVASQVQNLDLNLNSISDAGAAALGTVLSKTRVQYLALSYNQIRDLGAEGLARGLIESQVKSLDLGSNSISDAGAAALGAVLSKTRVQTLYLLENQIRDLGAEGLARGLIESQVKSLDLAFNFISDAGAAALGAVLPKTKVQTLHLFSNQIRIEGAEGLAQGLVGSQVQSLVLWGNSISDAGAAALGAVLPKTRVQILYLDENQIGDAGMEGLAQGLVGSQVLSLRLGSNSITDAGAATLGAVLPKTRVQDLGLSENQIGIVGAEGLAQGLVGSQVQSLNLRDNHISDAGAAALGTVLPKTKVQILDLYSNQIRIVGAEGLAQGLVGSQVQSLNLRDNHISDAGAAALGTVLPKTKIQILDLWSNQIRIVGAEGLAQGLVGSQVQSLVLWGNSISDAGAAALGTVLPKTRVQTLNLYVNQIGVMGAEDLARGLVESQVKSLDLAGNSISDAGAAALGAVLPKIRVHFLDLSYNQIGDMGAEGLALGLPGSPLQSLYLYGNKVGDKGATAIAKALTKPQAKHHQLWINSFDTRDGKTIIFEPNTALRTLNLRTNTISDEGASALCYQLPATYIEPSNLYLLENPNISASTLANCGIITSGASHRFSRGPVLIFKSLVWDTGILGIVNLMKNIPTLFPYLSTGDVAVSTLIPDIVPSLSIPAETFYPPMPSAMTLGESHLKPFLLITDTLKSAPYSKEKPGSQIPIHSTVKQPTMDLGGQLLLGQFIWHLGKKYSPFTLPWNKIRTISKEEERELLQMQEELQQQGQRFRQQERWLKRRNLREDRSEEIKHLKDTIGLLQISLQQTLSSRQSSTTLLSDHKKALLTIKKQNDSLIVGDAPIPTLGSRLKQVYNYFTKASSSTAPQVLPQPSSKMNKQQMKRLAIERNRRLRRAEKTGMQAEVLVSRQLGGKLSQTFTNSSQTILQFSSFSTTTQKQNALPTFDRQERDLEKTLTFAYGAGKLPTGIDTGILSMNRESKPRALSSTYKESP